MTLKRFISYSLIIHMLAVSSLFTLSVKKEQRVTPFFARLVSPEDSGLGTGETIMPQTPVLPEATQIPPAAKSQQPSPPISQSEDREVVHQKLETSKDSQPTTLDSQPSITQGDSSSTSQRGGDTGSTLSEKAILPHGTGGTQSFPLKRENLFDRDIIARSIERGDRQERSTITLDAKEFQSYGYMQRLKEKIEGIWQYPPEAVMRGIYGDLFIEFTINRNGSLGGVELIRTSGYRSLDEAAIKALKDAAPYWPLPDDWKKNDLTIKGHFIYHLYGVYIR